MLSGSENGHGGSRSNHHGHHNVIVDLPNEVTLTYLCLLDTQDLVKYRLVCRHWRDLIDTDVVLQYKIELWANDMVDGPPSEFGIKERLKRLREYQRQSQSSHLFCDSGTEFGHEDAVWFIDPPSTDGSAMSHAIDDHLLSATIASPPSVLRHIEKRVWTIRLNGIPDLIFPITVDAAQDLLMVIARPPNSREYTTHFLSLGRAGETHPDAISPVTRALPPELQGAFWLSVQSPQICGQHAAWLLSGTGPCGCHVEVWDWKAGKLVWTRTFPNDVIFTFLDPFHIALVGKAFSGPRSLVIYRVASADVDPVCSLGLPPLVSPGSSLIFCDKIICNTRPAGTWPTSTAPFQHDPAAALVIIHFGVSHRDDVIPWRFLLLVPVRTLYQVMEEMLSLPRDARPESVQWSRWGPRGSLLLSLNDESRRKDLSPIHRLDIVGPRLALPFQVPQAPRGTEQIVFLGFNRAARRYNRADPAALALFHSSTQEWGDTFAESVRQSFLPYQVIAGPKITLVDPQDPWPVSVRMVVQPDGFTLIHARSRRNGGPKLDIYHL